jgi:hypothetical protein
VLYQITQYDAVHLLVYFAIREAWEQGLFQLRFYY